MKIIRYSSLCFVTLSASISLGTALADWVGRRPSAILAALIDRARTGDGARIVVSMTHNAHKLVSRAPVLTQGEFLLALGIESRAAALAALAAAAAVDAVSKSRRENRIPLIVPPKFRRGGFTPRTVCCSAP